MLGARRCPARADWVSGWGRSCAAETVAEDEDRAEGHGRSGDVGVEKTHGRQGKRRHVVGDSLVLELLDHVDLVGRQYLGMTSVEAMPTFWATDWAVRALSPVRSTGRSPSSGSSAMARAEVCLMVSETTTTARTAPSHATQTGVRPSASANRMRSLGAVTDHSLASQERRPAIAAWPSTTPQTPLPPWSGLDAGGRESREADARRGRPRELPVSRWRCLPVVVRRPLSLPELLDQPCEL